MQLIHLLIIIIADFVKNYFVFIIISFFPGKTLQLHLLYLVAI